MYCQKCGKEIPDNSTYCNSCGASQGLSASFSESNGVANHAGYKAVSWTMFALLLLYGIASLVSGSSDRGVVHSIVICLASLVFSPAITIKSLDNSPWILLIVKFLVAGGIILFL